MEKHKRIYKLFLYSKKLRFSEMEERSGMRSNELAYYLKALQTKGLLEKKGEVYSLSAAGQKKLPYYTDNDELSPLPVVLVRCFDAKGNILFVQREKLPYEGLWSLPGGRLVLGETVATAAQRILKEKAFAQASVLGVHAVCNERLLEKSETRHAFVLFVVNAELQAPLRPKATRRLFAADSVPKEWTIPSDYFLSLADPGFYECVLTPREGTDPVMYDAFFQPSTGAMFDEEDDAESFEN